MEWTFPENVTMPEGGETRFTSTSFRGKTYFDVTLTFPSQYSVFKASRSKTQQMTEYIEWVEQHFTFDPSTKQVRPRASPGSSSACTHPEISHKGSNHYYLKYTCLVCGESWSEPRERDVPMRSPETCPHLNTDHRGSTKKMLRTYCKDCCTVIDIAPRDLAQEVAREQEMSPEERELL